MRWRELAPADDDGPRDDLSLVDGAWTVGWRVAQPHVREAREGEAEQHLE